MKKGWAINAVEGLFALLVKPRLKRGVFHSLKELTDAIHSFIADTNANPKPFIWTKDPGKIIAAVKRGHQSLDRSTRWNPVRFPSCLLRIRSRGNSWRFRSNDRRTASAGAARMAQYSDDLHGAVYIAPLRPQAGGHSPKSDTRLV
jgi:hypothetical protein